MILGLDKKDVYTSGVQNSYNFTIGDEAMIISILRDKLYSNPKKTLIQEYVSNARDAHREVGKAEVPVEIYLPGKYDRFLKVKDFGPGISPSRARDVFCGYGNSTKRSSDKETGGFGIGAKSAWSYVDSFNIETIVDSKKYYYSCYIDATNKGKMDLLQVEDTEEENGTSVIIPVKESDIYIFHQLVTTLFKYWTVKPKIIGADIKFPSFDIIATGKVSVPYTRTETVLDDIELIKEIEIQDNVEVEYVFHGEDEKFILIDELRYPINLDKMTVKDSNTLKYLNHVCFKFNTGILSINPNREDIIYDERTSNIINSMIKVLLIDIIDIIQKEVDTIPTLIEAYALMKDKMKIYPIIDIFKNVKWNDYYLSNGYVNYLGTKYTCITCNKNNGRLNRSDSSRLIPLKSNNVYYVNDENKITADRRRLRTLLFDRQMSEIVVIQPNYTDDTLDYNEDIVEDKILKDLNVINLSTIPKSKTITSNRIKGNCKAYVFNYSNGRRTNWDLEDINYIDDSGIYVIVSDGSAMKYSSDMLNYISKICKIEILGIPIRYKEKIEANTDFEELTEYIKRWHPTFELPKDKIIQYNLSKYRTYSIDDSVLRTIKKILPRLDDADFFKNLIDSNDHLMKTNANSSDTFIDEYIKICVHFNLTYNTNSDNVVDEKFNTLTICKKKFDSWYLKTYKSVIRYTYSIGSDELDTLVELFNSIYQLKTLTLEYH